MAILKSVEVIVEEQEATVAEYNAVKSRIKEIPQVAEMWADINAMMFALYGELNKGLSQPQINALSSAGAELGLAWKKKEEA